MTTPSPTPAPGSAPVDPFATASELLGRLRARQLSAVELLELHLSRIERYNPALNAIIYRDVELARRAARAADEARARGDDRPLLGLPITIKESINVAGMPTTVGMPMWADYVAPANSRLAERALAAGAVLLGKTNIPPMLMDYQANNPIYGRTNNPWNLDLTPGGSTGGGGAALAAGLTPLEFGSDIGGSIRVPAAFCGVFGHKPSETALPRSGQFPGTLPNAALVLPVQGPLARGADDLELALDVVAGPEVGEDAAWRLDLPPARHERLRDFRVAVLPPVDWLPVSAEVAARLDGLVGRLRAAGARVEVTQPESFGDLRAHHETYLSLLFAITSAGSPEAERRDQVAALRGFGDGFSLAMARGVEANVGDWFAWHGQRETYRAAYRDFFQSWDILLAPIVSTTAFPHQPLDIPPFARTLVVDGVPMPVGNMLGFPALATLSGQPATAFPLGLSPAGLPIGAQAIGPYLADRTPIRFAALVAREFGGFQPPTGYTD